MPAPYLGESRFDYRVGGIAIDGDSVLLHRRGRDAFWTLPSWRTNKMETAPSQLGRRIAAGCGSQAVIGRLALIVESLYEYEEAQCHDLTLCFLARFEEGAEILGRRGAFTIHEADPGHTFEWLRIEDLDRIDLRPSALRQLLRRLPDRAVYVVHDEVGNG